jgi:hypothetical protein
LEPFWGVLLNINQLLSDLAALSQQQLFFVGGAPRSGTTWLQEILDRHPNVSCRGEGHFLQLATSVDAVVATRAGVIASKNASIFGWKAGYPVPNQDDADLLIATWILAALARQRDNRQVKAVGEKTPDNVFFFSRLKRLFPRAKFIAIVRDPRDVITSAWHFFPRPVPRDEISAKTDFLKLALPSLNEGLRALVDFGREHADDLLVVTYEALKVKPARVIERLYEFLGVVAEPTLIDACVARTSFGVMSQVSSSGGPVPFFRKGVVGDWPNTLTQEMSGLVVKELGWAFETFGWRR